MGQQQLGGRVRGNRVRTTKAKVRRVDGRVTVKKMRNREYCPEIVEEM